MGSGRKPGGGLSPSKTGITRELRAEARSMLADIIGSARDPLNVAIELAADITNPPNLRLEAALGASRFLHPVLSAAAVQHSSARPDAGAVVHRLTERLARLAPAPMLEAEIVPSREGVSADVAEKAQ